MAELVEQSQILQSHIDIENIDDEDAIEKNRKRFSKARKTAFKSATSNVDNDKRNSKTRSSKSKRIMQNLEEEKIAPFREDSNALKHHASD